MGVMDGNRWGKGRAGSTLGGLRAFSWPFGGLLGGLGCGHSSVTTMAAQEKEGTV